MILYLLQYLFLRNSSEGFINVYNLLYTQTFFKFNTYPYLPVNQILKVFNIVIKTIYQKSSLKKSC